MDPFGRIINLILWRNDDGMFLGRLCMEDYIIDHMLLEDKLKEISVKSDVSVQIQIEGYL